ncbi:TlpA family protein disulfide reductase [Acidovorax soli]|uniref:TlpA family protein disulfide reductase n=1 Tax=Acidovorax soli TaxID=592050 RepID=UPI0032B18AEA
MRRRRLLGLFGVAGAAPWAGLAAASPGFDVQDWNRQHAQPPVDWVDLQGGRWSLPSLKGRAVLLNFWASWCEPCRTEMPALQALADRERERLAVLAINLKETSEAIARFVHNTGLSLPVVRDVQGDIAKAWGIRIYPSTVLIDTEGRARSVVRGALDWAGPEGERLWQPLLQPQRARKR